MKRETEREIKVLNINSSRIEKRIYELGGTQVLDDLTTMEWFDASPLSASPLNGAALCGNRVIHHALTVISNNHKSLRDQGMLLRLRKQKSVFDLTLKQKMSDNKSLITTNSEISELYDEGAACQVRKDLLANGFHIIATHEKKRRSYFLSTKNSKVRVDLDTWPSIPEYMEIEGENSDCILEAISLLGVEENETSNLTGEEFFSKYGVDFFSNLSFNN